MSKKTNVIERPVTTLLATSHQSIDAGIRGAIDAVIRAIEVGDTLVDGLVAVLVDPWSEFRRTDVDVCVLRQAVGTDLRWIALPGARADLHQRVRTLRTFAPHLRSEAAVVAFMDHDGTLVVVVQRRGHADLVVRSTVTRGSKGKVRLGYMEIEPRVEVEAVAVLPTRQHASAAASWPRTPF